MKKRFIALGIVLLASLASCNTGNGSSTSSSSTSSSSNSPISSTEDSSSSSSSMVTPPSFSKDDFSYLIGDYYAKNASLTIDEKNLVLKTDSELKLIPTNVEETTFTYEVEDDDGTKKEESYDTIKVEFSSEFNDLDYRAYVNFSDGLLHLESLDGDEDVTTIGTFMPSIKEFAGSYSAYGDSSTYNMYVLFSGEFDLGRGVFPSTHKFSSSISDEQAWYITSSFTMVDDKVYKQIQEYDEDAYGYGKNIIYKDKTKGKIYVFSGSTIDYDSFEYVTDVGVLQNLSLFNGEKTVSLNINPKDKTISFDSLSGTYETLIDDEGLKVKATMNEKEYIISFGERYIKVASEGKENLYPIDTIDDLYGSYSDGTNTFVIEEQYDDDYNVINPKVSFNDESITYKFVINNKRKAISFEKDGKTYILSPDKKGDSIRLDVNNAISYPINIEKFKSYYLDTFIEHQDGSNIALTISDDMSFIYKDETGKARFEYQHGDHYPSLKLKTDKEEYSLNLVQQDIGYYIFNDGKDHSLYSLTALNSAYGEYSSDGENSFIFDAYHIVKDGIASNYTFEPFYNESTGLYLFGVVDDNGEQYVCNLVGTFINKSSISYVKKSLYSEIAGTYQAYGKYGIENIQFTMDGKLILDIVNSDNTGLEKGVEFDYTIYTNANNKAVIIFTHRNVSLTITFKEHYVEIANLSYYDSGLVQAWGTYSDSKGNKTLYVQEDKLYLDGESLSIDSIELLDDKTIYHTSSYTITYYQDGDNFTLDSSSTSIKLTRKLSYTDLDKFVGTYTINNSEVKVSKSSTIGYDVTVSNFPIFSPYCITTHNGKLALTFSDSNGKYYLMLDETTGEITTDFEASSIPVPPPLPTHF